MKVELYYSVPLGIVGRLVIIYESKQQINVPGVLESKE